MASNYVTSDGKDLDSRYLAIGGKAASAGYADSAGSATNVTNKGRVVRNGAAIKVNVKGSPNTACWTATSDGVMYSYYGRISVNQPLRVDNGGAQIAWINKGDKIYVATESSAVNENFPFAPVKIS